MPDISWEDNCVKTGSNQVALSESLLDIVTEAGLSQINSSPTRGDHLLDLYFTNNPTLVRQVKVRPGLGDHDSAIMVDSLIKPLVNKSVPRKVYQFHKGNLADLNYELSKFKTKFLTNCEAKSVEDLWNSYHSEMMLLQEKFIPSKSVKSHQSQPWIMYCLLSVVLNNYVIKQIAVKSIHKLILFIEQK